MFLDKEPEVPQTTLVDSQFNVICSWFLDGRPPLMVGPRVWPRTQLAWNSDKAFSLAEGEVVKNGKTYKAKLVVGRLEAYEVVWSGNMPDQKGGYTKGELLGAAGYGMCPTMGVINRARLLPFVPGRYRDEL
jgi:hypothetical protein